MNILAHRYRSICVFLLLMAARRLAAEPSDKPQIKADLPYQAQRTDPITHDVDFQVVVTPPYHCKVLKVWLPLPSSDAGQEISDRRLSTFPETIEPRIAAEPIYGNRFAYFEFNHPEGAQIIRHQFRAKVWTLNWDLDPHRVQPVASWPDDFAPYLRPQPISEQERYDAVLRETVPAPRSPVEDLIHVMDWVDKNLTYDHAHASLRADASFAFKERQGHCSDYHGLCSTMARSLGYPARVTYGLSLFPKNSPSHCKFEAYLPPYGWVSFDVSETQRMVKKISASDSLEKTRKDELARLARERLRRGFRENSWLLMTRGTGYDLVPKASRPVSVVRTIYAEADGEPLPDPDPANGSKREYGWMTAHHYQADHAFKRPFEDLSTLEADK